MFELLAIYRRAMPFQSQRCVSPRNNSDADHAGFDSRGSRPRLSVISQCGVAAMWWMIVSVRRVVHGRFLRWFGPFFFFGLGILLLWIAFRTAETMFIWTHYQAEVGRCFGGRGN